MATTETATQTVSTASGLARSCREASFLTIYAARTGDGLAAAAQIASIRQSLDKPFQVSLVSTPADRRQREAAADDSTQSVALETTSPASRIAYEAADELAVDPEPVLALTGLVAAGESIDSTAPDMIADAGLNTRPGIASPTTNPVDGLAYSTLVHTEFSGDSEAARAAIQSLEERTPKTVASLLAQTVAGDEATTDRAAMAVERVLGPYELEGPVSTLTGYADLVAGLARTAPGVGLSVMLNQTDLEPAIEHWREYATAVHSAVRDATLQRYGGVVTVETDGPPETVARLLRDYRAPEPVVLAYSDREVAIAGVESGAGEVLIDALDACDGHGRDDGTRGYGTVPAGETDTLIQTITEAL